MYCFSCFSTVGKRYLYIDTVCEKCHNKINLCVNKYAQNAGQTLTKDNRRQARCRTEDVIWTHDLQAAKQRSGLQNGEAMSGGGNCPQDGTVEGRIIK